MKRIKLLLAVCAFTLFSGVSLFGQDMAAATELFNSGASALNENNYAVAIESFSKAIKMAEGLGEEGQKIVNDVKSVLPQIYLRYGKELAASKKLDEAIAQLKKAIEVGKAYGAADVEKEAAELIPQIVLADGTTLYSQNKFTEAIAEFKKAIAMDPENARAYFLTGVCESKLGNIDGAVAAFEKAVELGDTDGSPKQLATIFLKKSAADVKAKNWAGVYENAKKSDDYMSTSQAAKLAGIGAFQLKKFKEATEALDKYLSMDPEAKDKNNMYYYLALSYESLNNPAKACGYYKLLVNDPTYKATAEYKIKTQLKCN